jgi:hypothetical protein
MTSTRWNVADPDGKFRRARFNDLNSQRRKEIWALCAEGIKFRCSAQAWKSTINELLSCLVGTRGLCRDIPPSALFHDVAEKACYMQGPVKKQRRGLKSPTAGERSLPTGACRLTMPNLATDLWSVQPRYSPPPLQHLSQPFPWHGCAPWLDPSDIRRFSSFGSGFQTFPRKPRQLIRWRVACRKMFMESDQGVQHQL